MSKSTCVLAPPAGARSRHIGGCPGRSARNRARLAPEQAATFWAGVERRIRTDTTAAARPARPALREVFWDHPRLSLASAVAAVILVLGVTLGQMEVWSPWAPTVPNGVEVISIEAGEDAPVMVFQAPGSSLKVIWVFEKPTS